MDLVFWMNKCADFMYYDRPDVFVSPHNALEILERWIDHMRRNGNQLMASGGYELSYTFDDEAEFWELKRILASCDVYLRENEVFMFDWTSGTSNALSHRMGLPSDEDE